MNLHGMQIKVVEKGLLPQEEVRCSPSFHRSALARALAGKMTDVLAITQSQVVIAGNFVFVDAATEQRLRNEVPSELGQLRLT